MSVLPPSYTEVARACLNCRHSGWHTKRAVYICMKIDSKDATFDDRIVDTYGHCAEFEWCEDESEDHSSP
jgi:hypothetical protein